MSSRELLGSFSAEQIPLSTAARNPGFLEYPEHQGIPAARDARLVAASRSLSEKLRLYADLV